MDNEHHSKARDRIDEKDPLEYRNKLLFFENRIEREWLTTNEAAHFLGISENALRILVHRGQVPVFKFGRRLKSLLAFRICAHISSYFFTGQEKA